MAAEAQPQAGGVQTTQGWLPALLPADARSFRVSQPDLAGSLLDAGATVTEGPADVEIASPWDAVERADYVLMPMHATQSEGGNLGKRVVGRLQGSLRVRRRASEARRRLRAAGWTGTNTVLWDVEQPVHLPGVRVDPRDLRPAEFLPQRAVVSAWRGSQPPTLLDAVAAEAAAAVGEPILPRRVLARAGMTVVLCDAFVLRVVIGPGRHKIELLEAALDALRRTSPPEVVDRRVPWVLARGRTGIAEWSLERRLEGHASTHRFSPALLDDCVDFLVALHRGGADGPGRAVSEDARIVAAACPEPADAERVIALGRQLDAGLAALPRGFGHGDFWAPNLLVRHGRLSGVVDWDSAAPGRLPAIDLLHLELTAERERKREYIGEGVTRHHLAWARGGGDDVVRTYARRLGIHLGPELLESLVLAYWLDRIAFELRVYADRTGRPVWMHNNIRLVLDALAG